MIDKVKIRFINLLSILGAIAGGSVAIFFANLRFSMAKSIPISGLIVGIGGGVISGAIVGFIAYLILAILNSFIGVQGLKNKIIMWPLVGAILLAVFLIFVIGSVQLVLGIILGAFQTPEVGVISTILNAIGLGIGASLLSILMFGLPLGIGAGILGAIFGFIFATIDFAISLSDK